MEIIMWLDAGVIYPIADSNWVYLVQCVPKKGGITVVPNEINELVPMWPVTGWRVSSSDEATSSETVTVPQNEDPTPVAGEPNRWFVEGQRQIYRDAKMKNDKEKMARLITDERRVLTGSLHTVPDIHRLLNFTSVTGWLEIE
ncbi:uncharacterized protein LOC125833842 [Solanum verrucosum]|uniref:uncharacterized protein LOC125833842 n=1 Tax=Solanum verrucosum TaxID=315347 RepID=UPI0020D0CDAA|nr:uncharacterized protein LOC125833842 [Solanum verrucosum]